jgi:UDP-N-acetylglucosamine--N-acetylmuramyl-(pentapeptide) pyrophosphoryl-undecaprenol N-acetylglucosamine transferase
VLHLAGERDYPALAERGARREYRLLPFTDDFGAALAAADLVVARAGGSVWEIAAAGRAALLVPYPHATADHQTENARYFERGGGAVVVPEPELDLRPQVDDLLADPERLQKMGEAMKSLARPHAAEDIAKELLRLAS